MAQSHAISDRKFYSRQKFSNFSREAAARLARKDHGAAYFCVCGGTCPPLLFGALPVTPASTDVWPPWRSRAHVLPQGRCLGSRGFGLGSPSSRACFGTSARARQRGWRLNSGAPPAHVSRTLCPHAPDCTSAASLRSLTPDVATGLPVHKREGHSTYARRAPPTARSVGTCSAAPLLRSSFPGASADSLTRHATPAVSSCCTTLPPHHWSLGPSRYAFCRSAIPRFTHSPTRRGPAAAAQHSPGRVLSLSLRQ